LRQGQAARLADLLDKLGMTGLTVGAVCVYHDMVPTAVAALRGTASPSPPSPPASPRASRPSTSASRDRRVRRRRRPEIDIVISRRHVLTGNWQALYDEMREMRAACGPAHVKAILATGELGTLRNVARASTGLHDGGRRLHQDLHGQGGGQRHPPVTLAMIRAIREYHEATGIRVGYKPAGGISKAKDALTYLAMIKDELGDRWLQPDLFRFGASSLLGDIERQLEHHVTGAYSASWRHPLA
jgi:deoxyribose-phosphate aldolase